ncbi:hypothetical protein E8E14_001653 [Neopestalotiopsis sp. 37M]|nr:hypothetical protein E8E14_001653 [Neopestalotiopsis sp. 37M]
MRGYYAQAAITYVMVPEWSPTFTWEVDGFSMNDEQAARAGKEVEALRTTTWASRVWTFEEASLSGRTVFVGKNVAKSAVELAVATALDQLRDKRKGCANCSTYPRRLMRQRSVDDGWDGCTCERRHGLVHAVWRRHKENNTRYRDGSTSVSVEGSRVSSFVFSTHLLRDRVILTDTHTAKTEYEYLDEIWRRSGQRHCSKEEDRVYGMLGLVRRGNTMTVEYGIGFEEAVKRAADKGLVSQGVFLAATKSTKPGRSWYPALGTEGRWRKDNWSMTSQGTSFEKIQLTAEGLWMVQGARCQPRDPERPERILGSSPMFLFEGDRREFIIDFKHDVPHGVEWQGDWLAVVNGPLVSQSVAATLIKYKMGEDGRLVKLEALGVNIRMPGRHDRFTARDITTRDFLLG